MGNTASAVGKAFGYGSREAQTATDQSVDFQRAAAGVKICGHVWTRQSSQYLDEDGHMAHEFYEEVWIAPNKWVMKQIAPAVLRPVGRVYLKTPCLHVDSKVVLCPVEEGESYS